MSSESGKGKVGKRQETKEKRRQEKRPYSPTSTSTSRALNVGSESSEMSESLRTDFPIRSFLDSKGRSEDEDENQGATTATESDLSSSFWTTGSASGSVSTGGSGSTSTGGSGSASAGGSASSDVSYPSSGTSFDRMKHGSSSSKEDESVHKKKNTKGNEKKENSPKSAPMRERSRRASNAVKHMFQRHVPRTPTTLSREPSDRSDRSTGEAAASSSSSPLGSPVTNRKGVQRTKNWSWRKQEGFDIDEALQQVSRNTESERGSQNGRLVTLILGTKGSGKSTLFRHILDYSATVSSNKLATNANANARNDEGQQLRSGNVEHQSQLRMLRCVLPSLIDALAQAVNQAPIDSSETPVHSFSASDSNARIKETLCKLFATSEHSIRLRSDSKAIEALQKALNTTKLSLDLKESTELPLSFETAIRELIVQLRWLVSWMNSDPGFTGLYKPHRNAAHEQRGKNEKQKETQREQTQAEEEEEEEEEEEPLTPAEVLNDCRWDIVRLSGEDETLSTLLVLQYRLRSCAHLALLLESTLALIDCIVPDETSVASFHGASHSALDFSQSKRATTTTTAKPAIAENAGRDASAKPLYQRATELHSTATTANTSLSMSASSSAPPRSFADTVAYEIQKQSARSLSWSIVTQKMVNSYLSMVRQHLPFERASSEQLVSSTTGSDEDIEWSIHDLSHRRRDWYKYIPSANRIIFVFGLDSLLLRKTRERFTCTTFKLADPIGEALSDFYSICSSPYLKETKFLVVLNKLDILTCSIGEEYPELITRIVQNVSEMFRSVFQEAATSHDALSTAISSNDRGWLSPSSSPSSSLSLLSSPVPMNTLSDRFHVVVGSCTSTLLPDQGSSGEAEAPFNEITRFLGMSKSYHHR